jgi:protein KRI1
MSTVREKYGSDAELSDEEEEESTDSEEGEPEDEDGELVTPQVDAQIFKTIAMIRNKDPSIYTPDVRFFEEADLQKAKEQWEAKRAAAAADSKPMTLMDYHRKELLAGGADSKAKEEQPLVTHTMQQEAIKEDFKRAALRDAGGDDDDDDGDDLLTMRRKSADEVKEEEDAYAKFLLQHVAGASEQAGASMQDWKAFAGSQQADPREAFLMEYILSKGWVDKAAKRTPSYEEIVGPDAVLSEDEDAVEAAEQFERQHNFRYEEEGADQIVG